MTRNIAQRELRNDNAKVIDAVTAGETFVVTRNGERFRRGRGQMRSARQLGCCDRRNRELVG